jgi:hypothetical protein
MQLHATSDHYDFDFHAFSLSGFDVTVNKQENGSTDPSMTGLAQYLAVAKKFGNRNYVSAQDVLSAVSCLLVG